MVEFELVPGQDNLDALIALNDAIENHTPMAGLICVKTKTGVDTYMIHNLRETHHLLHVGYSFGLASEAMTENFAERIPENTRPIRNPEIHMRAYLMYKLRQKRGKAK